jgi:hypothetical protein
LTHILQLCPSRKRQVKELRIARGRLKAESRSEEAPIAPCLTDQPGSRGSLLRDHQGESFSILARGMSRQESVGVRAGVWCGRGSAARGVGRRLPVDPPETQSAGVFEAGQERGPPWAHLSPHLPLHTTAVGGLRGYETRGRPFRPVRVGLRLRKKSQGRRHKLSRHRRDRRVNLGARGVHRRTLL